MNKDDIEMPYTEDTDTISQEDYDWYWQDDIRKDQEIQEAMDKEFKAKIIVGGGIFCERCGSNLLINGYSPIETLCDICYGDLYGKKED